MHLVNDLSSVTKETILWLPVCLPAHKTSSEKRYTLNEKNLHVKKQSTFQRNNLLPRGANSFCLE